jgi:hypothetical protein
MEQNLMLVFSNPAKGREDEFNSWYSSRHLVEVCAVDGVVSARRYELAQMELPDKDEAPVQLPAPTHRYLAVYTLDDRDPTLVMKDFVARVAIGEMDLSESLDLASVSVATWSAIGEPYKPQEPGQREDD